MILIDEQIPLLDQFRALDDTIVFTGRSLTHQQVKESGCTTLIVRSTTRIDGALLEGTSVRRVATATAGVDHIDEEYLRINNIEFFSAPGSNADAVADYVFSVLSFMRIPASCTIGVVGHGQVGSRVASRATAAGMNVLVRDPLLNLNSPLTDLLEQCDVVTLHVPLTIDGDHKTERMIAEKQLALMKPQALLVNTSRGQVVDVTSLVSAVSGKRIRAAIDVFENEPEVSPTAVDVYQIATPHIAGYTEQAKINGAVMILQQLDPSFVYSEHEAVASSKAESISPRRNVGAISSLFKVLWKKDPSAQTFDALRRKALLM